MWQMDKFTRYLFKAFYVTIAMFAAQCIASEMFRKGHYTDSHSPEKAGCKFHDRIGCKLTVKTSGLWQMFRTFVLRCDWSILRILKSTKKHERQSELVTLVSIYNNIF